MCKNPHHSAPTKVKLPGLTLLPPLPGHIIRSGKSKNWFINTSTGKYIHRGALEEFYKLK